MKAEKKTTTAYYVEDAKVIEENPDGTYQICYPYYLSAKREHLTTLHAVLGEVLTDLADAAEDAAVEAELKPPF
jgi:hypothetical protein